MRRQTDFPAADQRIRRSTEDAAAALTEVLPPLLTMLLKTKSLPADFRLTSPDTLLTTFRLPPGNVNRQRGAVAADAVVGRQVKAVAQNPRVVGTDFDRPFGGDVGGAAPVVNDAVQRNVGFGNDVRQRTIITLERNFDVIVGFDTVGVDVGFPFLINGRSSCICRPRKSTSPRSTLPHYGKSACLRSIRKNLSHIRTCYRNC